MLITERVHSSSRFDLLLCCCSVLAAESGDLSAAMEELMQTEPKYNERGDTKEQQD